MNIVLIGMRGSGKSTISRNLAKILKKDFVEVDELIEKKAKMTIPQIVKNYGWKEFRNYESDVVKEIFSLNNKIIATGGGVVARKKNVENLQQNGLLIWLTASVDTLIKRIGKDPKRPFLTKAKSMKEDLKNTLLKRNKLYLNAASIKIDTDKKNPNQICSDIIRYIKKTKNYDQCQN